MIKIVETDRYQIRFNTETGYEELEGINGNPDPFVLDYPSLIDVGIMGNCQNKCEYCYQGDHSQDHMTLDNFKKIVDEIKDHTNQMALGGRGNPNKHPQFQEFLEYARNNNVIPNYTTSGLDITDKEVELSKLSGAVAVSSHNKDYTFNAINKFVDAGIKTNIHFVLSKKSMRDAFKLMSGIDPWNGNIDLNKVNAIIFLLFKPQGRAKELKDWIPDPDALRLFNHLIPIYYNVRKFNFMIGMDSCMVNKLIKSGAKLTEEQRQSIDSCEGARMSCYISPDMKLMPCSFGGADKGISIIDKTIKEVWDNGQEFLDFRHTLCKDAACCPYEL